MDQFANMPGYQGRRPMPLGMMKAQNAAGAAAGPQPGGKKPDHDGVAAFFGSAFDAAADTSSYIAVHGMTDTAPAPAPAAVANRPQNWANANRYAGVMGMSGPAFA